MSGIQRRLGLEHVDARARQVAAVQRVGQGLGVHHRAAGGVDDIGPRFILAMFSRPMRPRESSFRGQWSETMSDWASSASRETKETKAGSSPLTWRL